MAGRAGTPRTTVSPTSWTASSSASSPTTACSCRRGSSTRCAPPCARAIRIRRSSARIAPRESARRRRRHPVRALRALPREHLWRARDRRGRAGGPCRSSVRRAGGPHSLLAHAPGFARDVRGGAGGAVSPAALANGPEALREADPHADRPQDAQADRSARARSRIPGAGARGRARASRARARRRQRRGRRGDGAGRTASEPTGRGRRGLAHQREDRATAESLRERRVPAGLRRGGAPLLPGRLVRPRLLVRGPRARTRRRRDPTVDRDGAASRRPLRVRRPDARAARDRPDPGLHADPRIRRPLPGLHREGAPADVRAPEGLSAGEGAGRIEARRAAVVLRADRVRLVLRLLRQGRRLSYRAAPLRLAAAAERPAIRPKTAPAINPAPPG